MGGNGSDWLNRLQQTTDGYYICGGQSSSPVSGEKTQALVAGSSDYWIIKLGMGIVLPIELISFTGANQGRTNELEWTTASENNSERFDVQRSADGNHWETIDAVAAAGSSQQARTYRAIDPSPFPLTYYRLRLVDADGSSALSDIVVVRLVADMLAVAPNPATDELTVFPPASFGTASIEMLGMDGRLLTKPRIGLFSSAEMFTLDIRDLPAGVYILQLRSGDKSLGATWVKTGS
jgi:hypothetical protein